MYQWQLLIPKYKLLIPINKIKDTACTKTIAGEEWLHNYLRNLDDTLINQVETNRSSRIFKFGDDHRVTAISPVKVLAQIEIKNCYYHWNCKRKTTLFLSKSSLKKANMVFNIKNNTIKMFGQNILLKYSLNGHYSVSVLSKIMSNFGDRKQVLIFKENETIEKRKKLIKLQKQFGHASSSSILNLVKNAGVDTKKYFKKCWGKNKTV